MTCYSIAVDGKTVGNYAIGDWFNGMLGLASYLKKQKSDTVTNIGVNIEREDIVNLFKYANFNPIRPTLPITSLHVDNLVNTKSNTYSMWNYFLLRNLTQNDMFTDFNIEGIVNEDITEDDIIIFPTTNGAELFNPEIYTSLIDDKFKGNVYWNKELIPYRDNIPKDARILSLGLMDLLATIISKKVRIIGHRSGIFDIFFHVLPPNNNKIDCVYDIRNEIQMAWQFKATMPYKNISTPIEFYEYIHCRETFTEIFI